MQCSHQKSMLTHTKNHCHKYSLKPDQHTRYMITQYKLKTIFIFTLLLNLTITKEYELQTLLLIFTALLNPVTPEEFVLKSNII